MREILVCLKMLSRHLNFRMTCNSEWDRLNSDRIRIIWIHRTYSLCMWNLLQGIWSNLHLTLLEVQAIWTFWGGYCYICCLKAVKEIGNKKFLLRGRKRHTARRVARGVDWRTKWKYILPHPSDAGGKNLWGYHNGSQSNLWKYLARGIYCSASAWFSIHYNGKILRIKRKRNNKFLSPSISVTYQTYVR